MIHIFHFSFIDNIRKPNGSKEVMEEDLPEIATRVPDLPIYHSPEKIYIGESVEFINERTGVWQKSKRSVC